MNLNPYFELILVIFAIATILTFIVMFFQGIWNIHKSINSQNELIKEQNELIKEYIELQKEKSPSNS